MTAREWLRSLGLESYADLLESQHVDLETLRILTDGDLQELGLPFGPRKRILHALLVLPGSAPTPGPSPAPPSALPAGGAPLGAAADGERRQLTVMFCDMVGFTELANRVDPEVLRGIIRRYEDACAACITRYEGFVFQRLGDGIVAFFGFPLAHEGEAERAIRAGLDIVDTLAETEVPEAGRLRVRIGLATGVVVVSAAERSAVGEAMNLAARLQGIAEPGQVVVSDRVHRMAAGRFEYTDLGLQTLKGIGSPTRAWHVKGQSAATTRFEAATLAGVTPLVGREEEFAQLLDRWERARTGAGQVVLVSGEAGIGKSRLMSVLRERLGEQGVETQHVQCSPYHVNSAFHPIIDHLSRRLSLRRDDPASGRLDALEHYMVTQLDRPRDDVPFVASILELPWRDRFAAPALSPRRHKEEGIRVLVDLAAAEARSRATLLLFEDVHWADPSTLQVIDVLIERVRETPLLVVLTHRPEFASRWGEQTHALSLDLSRLKRDESRAIVSRLTAGKAFPEALVTQIVNKADGIPLFVEELTKSVLESGELRDAGDHYTYAVGDHVSLPATLRDSLMARLDRVPAVREVAQVGAAIGRDFSYELLAAVSPMPAGALHDALERLTESGLAFRRGNIPDARFTFKHALVQDAAYDSLLRSRRQALHRAIAQVIESRFPAMREHEPELLARHYTSAGLDEAGIPLWRRAGELAMQRLALPEAIAHLRTGLARVEALPPGATRDRLDLAVRILLGPAVLAHRGWAAHEVSGILEPAWSLNQVLGDREAHLPVLHGLWVHYMCLARLATSLGWAERMLAVGRDLGDEELEICGHRAAMTSYFWMGRLREAKAHGDVILERYDPALHGHIAARTHSDPLTGDGIYRAHYLWMLGYADQARTVSAATAEHARRRNHPFDVAFALTLGAQVHEYCGDAGRLLACAEEAERIGREHGVPLMSEIMAEISRGEGWLLTDRPEEGIAQLGDSLARLSGTGHRVWVAYLGARLGAALAGQGDLARGVALVEENLHRDDCREDRVHLAEVLRLRGELYRQQGNAASAEEAFRESLAVAREQEARGWELRSALSLARALDARGARQEARDLLGPVFDWFSEGFDTRDLREARQFLQQLAVAEVTREPSSRSDSPRSTNFKQPEATT